MPPLGLQAEAAALMLNWIAEAYGSAGGRAGPIAFSGGMRAETPLAPVHLSAVRMEDGDIALSWLRRSRMDADGWGGDVVLELVGHPGVVDEGLRMTAPEGTYLEVGNINVGWKAEFDPSWIIFGNRRIIGVAHYEAEHLRGALELMQRTLKKYPWDKVVSHKFPLDEINEAFIQQDKGHVTRAAIVPN